MAVTLIYHTCADIFSGQIEVYVYIHALLGVICTVLEVYVCWKKVWRLVKANESQLKHSIWLHLSCKVYGVATGQTG